MSHLNLNIDYFKEINSNDKAYWLGYICADGNIKKSNNKVGLISKDLEVIKGFKEVIESSHSISKNSIFDGRTNKTYTGYSIQITNELFTKHLINLGVTSNKTNVLEFPNIDEEYYSYFIAGLFDGDGSVSWRGKNKSTLSITLISTNEILTFIKNYVLLKFNISPKYYYRVTENKSNVWKMSLCGDAHKFLDFIYSDKTFKYYLKRKYNKYLKNIENRKSIRHIRKVEQYDVTMKLIKVWNSLEEISNKLFLPHTSLRCNINRGTEYKNYIWKYERE
jgi:hypothetical protein